MILAMIPKFYFNTYWNQHEQVNLYNNEKINNYRFAFNVRCYPMCAKKSG